MSEHVRHPKCGKSWPNNNTIGHCSACCETFVGLRAFDMHRSYGECKALTSDDKWSQTAEGYWRYGPLMSQEDKDRLFG